MIDLIYAFAITVMAVSLIWRVCEGVIEAMKDLDEERRTDRENKKKR